MHRNDGIRSRNSLILSILVYGTIWDQVGKRIDDILQPYVRPGNFAFLTAAQHGAAKAILLSA